MRPLSETVKEAPISTFDYSCLSSNVRLAVRQHTRDIKTRLKRTAEDIWHVGHDLDAVRGHLNYGQFNDWLKTEFGWSRRTAYNFISVHEAFPNSTIFSDIDIAVTALYKLAASSTPQSVRDAFVARGQRGERVTNKKVKQALQATKTSSKQDVKSSLPAIVAIIPKDKVSKSDNDESEDQTSFRKAAPKSKTVRLTLVPNRWHLIRDKHTIYCGDTALPDFYEQVPYVDLALAISSEDWDHDWLIEKANNIVLLREEVVQKQGLIEKSLDLYSEPGKTILFPWLPDPTMLEVAHRLGYRVVAGDADIHRCQRAIEAAKLSAEVILI